MPRRAQAGCAGENARGACQQSGSRSHATMRWRRVNEFVGSRVASYNPGMNVSLFVTCLGDLFSPHVGMATVKVLEHFGCAVDFPADQTCCGQPQFNNGYFNEARPLAERMIRVFKDSQYIVTPSGSCCAMVREHYPVLFKNEPKWEDQALEFVSKTYELVEFLTKILKVDLSGLKLPEQTAI